MKKTCTRCNTAKDINNFHKNVQNPDGRHHYCKPCRGTKTPRGSQTRKALGEDVAVWLNEFTLTEPCVVCGAQADTDPFDTIAEARAHYMETAPMCTACLAKRPTTRTKLRMKRWTERADDVLTTVDVHHDLTMKLRKYDTLHKVYGVKAWFAGHRDDPSQEVCDLIEQCYEHRQDARTIHDLNTRIPRHDIRREKINHKREIAQSRFGYTEDGDSRFDLMLDGYL